MKLTVILMTLVLFVAACSAAEEPTATSAPPTEAEPTVEQAAPTAEEMAATEEATAMDDTTAAEEPMTTVERPAWQQIELTDARTGQTFTLADFEGRTVFVEPMATWCSNCRAQLNRVREVRQQLGEEDYAFIALSLETNLSNERLAQYTQDQNFDWTFAVMNNELLGLLADEFGRSITVAPSTPHFVIRPDGTFTDLSTGAKSVDELVNELVSESAA